MLLFAILIPFAFAAQVLFDGLAPNQQKRLQLSAVVNEEHYPYHAKIECWELENPFTEYPTVGKALYLGDVTNMTYVSLPPRSQEGLHHPPHNMFFVLLSGMAHVTLPADPDAEGLWIEEGVNPIIVAVDTLGIGHLTAYPGNKTTVALQIPFKNGVVPEHTVIGKCAC